MRNSGGASQEVVSVKKSTYVLTSLFHCTSYIVNRIPKEQGKGIIKKRQNPKTRQNRDNIHETDKKEGYKKKQHRGENFLHK